MTSVSNVKLYNYLFISKSIYLSINTNFCISTVFIMRVVIASMPHSLQARCRKFYKKSLPAILRKVFTATLLDSWKSLFKIRKRLAILESWGRTLPTYRSLEALKDKLENNLSVTVLLNEYIKTLILRIFESLLISFHYLLNIINY